MWLKDQDDEKIRERICNIVVDAFSPAYMTNPKKLQGLGLIEDMNDLIRVKKLYSEMQTHSCKRVQATAEQNRRMVL